MNIKVILAIFLLARLLPAFAYKANQHLPDLPELMEQEDMLSETAGETGASSPFVYGSGEATLENKLDEEVEQTSDEDRDLGLSHVSGMEEMLSEQEMSELKKFREDTGILVSGSYDSRDSLIENRNYDLLIKMNKVAKRSFSFTWFKDTYDYKDRRDVFTKTYEADRHSFKGGSLQITSDYYLYRGLFDFGLGGAVGISFNRGRGVFVTDGTQGPAEFKLWMIPVDLNVFVDRSLGKWFTVGGVFGPSAMGLFQTRSDFETGEKYKRRRQISYGYFGKAKLKFNLSYLMTKTGLLFYSSYDVTKVSLTLEARHQNYSNFQDDDISMSGTSLGLGFAFEHL